MHEGVYQWENLQHTQRNTLANPNEHVCIDILDLPMDPDKLMPILLQFLKSVCLLFLFQLKVISSAVHLLLVFQDLLISSLALPLWTN